MAGRRERHVLRVTGKITKGALYVISYGVSGIHVLQKVSCFLP